MVKHWKQRLRKMHTRSHPELNWELKWLRSWTVWSHFEALFLGAGGHGDLQEPFLPELILWLYHLFLAKSLFKTKHNDKALLNSMAILLLLVNRALITVWPSCIKIPSCHKIHYLSSSSSFCLPACFDSKVWWLTKLIFNGKTQLLQIVLFHCM